MKKPIILILVISMVFCMAACSKKAGDMDSTNGSTVNAANPGGETENSTFPGTDAPAAATPTEEPLHRLGPYSYPEVFAYYKELYGKTAASGEELDIPVYYETEILYHWDFFTLGVDSVHGAGVDIDPCFTDNLIAMPLLYEFPTVLRVQSDLESYAVYDIDSGYRLYILIKDYLFTGYPIVINHNKALLSLEDFDSIQVGDPFEKVEAIDDVATLHKKECAAFKDISQIAEGSQFTSVHYLTEGILMFRYRISGSGITVSEKTFYEDHILPTADGKMTSHKLCDLDLPDGNPVDLSGKTPLHRLGPTHKEEAFANYLTYYGIAEDSDKALDIPVYYEEELLFHEFDHFFLTQDASSYVRPGLTAYMYALRTLRELPTQLRVRADGSSYAVYDTDTGYRFFLFIHKSNFSLTGYPILINKSKMLSRADFSDIQVGDSIDKVIQIDDVASLHKKKIDSRDYDSNGDFFANQIMNGCEVATIHYLSDGILKINYQVAVPDSLDMTVSGIEFYEDYVIPTADGEMTSHKIKDIDLPQP